MTTISHQDLYLSERNQNFTIFNFLVLQYRRYTKILIYSHKIESPGENKRQLFIYLLTSGNSSKVLTLHFLHLPCLFVVHSIERILKLYTRRVNIANGIYYKEPNLLLHKHTTHQKSSPSLSLSQSLTQKIMEHNKVDTKLQESYDDQQKWVLDSSLDSRGEIPVRARTGA